jgi:fibronectin type 3 domain-containing protein
VAIRYNVYDVTATATAPNGAPPSRSSPPPAPLKLNTTPVAEPTFSDPRIAWGEKRCYIVRAVETFSDLIIESDAAPATCKTLVDTFPPAPPANLQSSPQEGAVTLIWDPNTEQDLDGYIVLRGASADALEPITAELIHVTQFRDEHLEPGVRFTYAIKAVDKAGNTSAPSNRVEEAAR